MNRLTPHINAYYHDYQGNIRAVGTGGEYGTDPENTKLILEYLKEIGKNAFKYTIDEVSGELGSEVDSASSPHLKTPI